MGTGPTNSSAPTTSQVVGAVYNATTPAPADKQAIALQVDNEGNLLVNVAVGGGGGSGTVKIEDTSGNALNSNGSGALQVAVVSGGGSNPSVGTVGATAPTSATEVGGVDTNGHLAALTIDADTGALSTETNVFEQFSNESTTATWTSATTVNTAISPASFTSGSLFTLIQNGGTVSGGTVVFEISPDGTNWFTVQAVDMSTGAVVSSYVLQASTNKTFSLTATAAQSRIRLSVAITGTLSVAVQAFSMAIAPASLVSVGNLSTGSTGPTAATAPAIATEEGLVALLTALPTAVTSGQLVGATGDKYGRTIVLPQTTRDLVGVQTTQIASSNSETTIVTSATGVFNDITGMQITNASATAVTVTIKDATAGTTRKVFDLAANGGIVVHFSPPLPQAAVTNNWTATLSINTVTVDINIDFVKNK